MKRFFDSSVLVPVFYADHQHHAPSARAFLAANKDDFCALRTFGEVYATLTGLPVRPRITGRDGIAIVKQIREKLTVISLTEQEYVSALESVSVTIVGGAAYDALIAHCAVKAGAEVLLTCRQPAVKSRPCSESLLLPSVNCFGWLASLKRRSVITVFDDSLLSSMIVDTLICPQDGTEARKRATTEAIVLYIMGMVPLDVCRPSENMRPAVVE